MSTEVRLTVLDNSSIRVDVTIRDFAPNNDLIDPTSQTWQLLRPNKSQEATTSAPTKISTGLFWYIFDIPDGGPSGTWFVDVIATHGGHSSHEQAEFEVEDA